MENHPTNPKVIYTGTAGGGVWKSDNAGTTFRPIFDDHSQSIGVVELDPNDPNNVIYVGTGEPWPRNSVSIGDGLYKSVDGGKSWKNIGFKNSERISDVIVNPDNSNEIYVGVLGALCLIVKKEVFLNLQMEERLGKIYCMLMNLLVQQT